MRILQDTCRVYVSRGTSALAGACKSQIFLMPDFWKGEQECVEWDFSYMVMDMAVSMQHARHGVRNAHQVFFCHR